jgi:hypothetical protein
MIIGKASEHFISRLSIIIMLNMLWKMIVKDWWHLIKLMYRNHVRAQMIDYHQKGI